MPAPVMLPGFYLEYVAFLLLPGFAVVRWLGYLRERPPLERLGVSIALSLCLDNLVLLSATRFMGIDAALVHSVVLGSAALVLASMIKYRPSLRFQIARDEKLILLFMVSLGVILLLHQLKYPIFSQYLPVDFRIHADIASSLLAGPSPLAPAVLYYAVHYQLAASLALTGGEALVGVQYAMAILVWLSLPVVYLGAAAFFGSGRVGVLASFLYLVPGSLWYSIVYISGLYPNFFAVVALFIFLWALAEVRKGAGRRPWALLPPIFLLMWFSHYSVVVVVPALLAVGAVDAVFDRRKFARTAAVAVGFILPFAGFFALKPELLPLLVGFMKDPGGAVVGQTFLSGLLAGAPVLAYLALAVSDDVAFLALAAAACFAGYFAIRKRDTALVFGLALMVLLFAAAPHGVGAWRFSDMAMTPFILLAAGGLDRLLPDAPSKRRRLRERLGGSRPSLRLATVVLIIGAVVLSGGPSVYMLLDGASDTAATSQAQRGVYDAMYWVKDNVKSPAGSLRILSVTNWWWLYAERLVGVQASYQWEPDPFLGSQIAMASHALIIAVTDPSSEATVFNGSTNPAWDLYPGPVPMRLLYNSTSVRLYIIGG